MIVNLQFFGGRGASSGGESLPNSAKGISAANIVSEMDVWSYRHNPNNEPFVDAMNESARTMADDFPELMNSVNRVNAATLKGADKEGTLGYYGDGSVSLNANYTNISKMNNVYDKAVASGYHPSRGNKSGTEAVMYHEMGHALTDAVKAKVGAKNLDQAAKTIVNNAYKNSGGKGGTLKWAGEVSGYAKESFAECIAEAVSDWYCNGNKASGTSKAIMKELKKYK